MKLAGIDIGTNTTRLIIFDKESNKVLEKRRIITRLGENFNGLISIIAKKRLIETLNYFKEIMHAHHISKLKAVGTSVIRECIEREQFIEEIFEKTGIRIEVIDGKKEAELTLKGVLWSLKNDIKDFILLDIGGGSNEYTLVEKREPKKSVSLNFGVVYLYEKFIKNDPPTDEELTNLANYIVENLITIENFFNKKDYSNYHFVGTAGTVTTLAAIHQNLKEYKPELINNHSIPKKFISNLLNKMVNLTNQERLKNYFLEKGREDVIIPGIMIILKTMEQFGFDEVISIDSGLLEGIIIELMEEDNA